MLTMHMFYSVKERDISKNNNPGQSDAVGWSVTLYTKGGGLDSRSGRLMFFSLSKSVKLNLKK